jgi:transposase-like protein
MPGKAAKIQVTERQHAMLEEIVASRTEPVRLVQRAKIVLLAFTKHNNEEVGEIVGLNPQQVSVWRKRWRDNWQRLISIECNESRSVLKKEIDTLLADQPRKGRTSKFTPEQQAAIIAIACENPDETSDRPIAQFTAREVAEEAIKREIVPTISASRVAAFLKSGRRSAAPKQVLAVSEN